MFAPIDFDFLGSKALTVSFCFDIYLFLLISFSITVFFFFFYFYWQPVEVEQWWRNQRERNGGREIVRRQMFLGLEICLEFNK